MTESKSSLDCASCYYYVQGIDRECVNYLQCTRAFERGLEHEQTCRIYAEFYDGPYWVDEYRLVPCGDIIRMYGQKPNYCPICGAKVVDE